jgi:methionyl-tRNA formyltransferase
MSIHNLLRNHKEVKKLINLLYKGFAETLNLDFRTPKNLKDNNEEYEYFKSIDADLAIVVAYGQIIQKNF